MPRQDNMEHTLDMDIFDLCCAKGVDGMLAGDGIATRCGDPPKDALPDILCCWPKFCDDRGIQERMSAILASTYSYLPYVLYHAACGDEYRVNPYW